MVREQAAPLRDGNTEGAEADSAVQLQLERLEEELATSKEAEVRTRDELRTAQDTAKAGAQQQAEQANALSAARAEVDAAQSSAADAQYALDSLKLFVEESAVADAERRGVAQHKEESESCWKATATADGEPYYYNRITQESSWERPPSMDACSPPAEPGPDATETARLYLKLELAQSVLQEQQQQVSSTESCPAPNHAIHPSSMIDCRPHAALDPIRSCAKALPRPHPP